MEWNSVADEMGLQVCGGRFEGICLCFPAPAFFLLRSRAEDDRASRSERRSIPHRYAATRR